MRVYTWVDTILNASSGARKKIRASVLEGMKYFGAKWEESPGESEEEFLANMKSKTLDEILSGPKTYRVKALDKMVQQLVKDLKSEKNMDFVGFVPEIQYVKEKGPKDQLEVLWEHPFGSPALLYAHKSLPMLIIAGPDIMFNDSMYKSIKSNKVRESVYGITG